MWLLLDINKKCYVVSPAASFHFDFRFHLELPRMVQFKVTLKVYIS